MGRELLRRHRRRLRGAGAAHADAPRRARSRTSTPRPPVEDLRLGQQQIVEIARALSVDSRILIMDEPTSALSAAEVEVLFRIIRRLTARGVSIVYISHHLEEALVITDHAGGAARRRDDGQRRRRRNRSRMDSCATWSASTSTSAPRPRVTSSATRCSGSRTHAVFDAAGHAVVDGLSLAVRAGEIVCLYGLMGAGRTELLEAIAGRTALDGGTRAAARGRHRRHEHRCAHRLEGLALVPEDRQRDGWCRR